MFIFNNNDDRGYVCKGKLKTEDFFFLKWLMRVPAEETLEKDESEE